MSISVSLSLLLYLMLGAYAAALGYLHAGVGRRGGGAVPLTLGLTFRLEGVEMMLLALAIGASRFGGFDALVLLALVRLVTLSRLVVGHGVYLAMKQQGVPAGSVLRIRDLWHFARAGFESATWAARMRLRLLVLLLFLLCLAAYVASALAL